MEDKAIINDKLFYRFVEFTIKLTGTDLTHETLKNISLDNYTAQTASELKVKRLADAFRYLINNRSSNVTKELIETAYFILANKRLPKKANEFILKKYYQRLDQHAHEKAAKMFLSLMDLKITSKMEFALLLTNFILIKRGFYPIIIYPNDKKTFKESIKLRRINPNDFYLFLVQAEHFIRKSHNHKVQRPEEIKTKEEVITILKNEEETLKREYHVNQLYLYGSYVKASNIATSDIDILIVFNDYLIDYQKQETMKKLKNYLYELMATRVDIMKFSHALSSLEINEMNNIITIF